ncbi:Uncharacterized protein SAPIO_CDS10810 [Scedosporium apiospermum]|uniref:Uncharacterized protein n=1 Tax=Pseudallescheria apiosperma TaxID=563466 RepID=A0A084FUL5_PSEDA|nr:Uncharacterized protein SAPIO_CDS10810 [Scedosporium apiospermum]KEZ38777.1 Uncharacterized protein SAPIO_CDS10810 [Scedosporium apiospermum]
MPFFNENSWAHHKPAASSPLSSSPIRPSAPLSPVNRNSMNQRNCFSSPPEPKSKFATRQTKPNPLLRKREEGQETRRQLFLRTVRGRADDRAWERRSIEGHALRRWYEEEQQIYRQKENDVAGMPTEEDLEDAITMVDQQDQLEAMVPEDLDDMMVDEIARQEELELEALLASYEQPSPPLSSNSQEGLPQRPPSPYYSDDEEYDQIFMELAENDLGEAGEDTEMS